ncbi:MAG: hypothetical protein Q8M19_29375 [Reyranella sp.]|nr:hypothetical protein [Reyranella sp.]
MWQTWLKANWLNLFQTLGILGAMVGLFLTYGQLSAANGQIEQAKNALRASTIFSIQKDGRELIQSISAEPKVYRLIFEFDKSADADAETQLKARVRIGQLINFYASMFNQYQAGAVDGRFWKTGLAELCVVLSTPVGSAAWREITSKGQEGYQPGFLKEGNTCIQKA